MATIINNPSQSNSGGPITLIIFLVVVLVLGYFGVVYGLPAMKSMNFGGTPTINVPSTINVPDKIDVNVKQSQ